MNMYISDAIQNICDVFGIEPTDQNATDIEIILDDLIAWHDRYQYGYDEGYESGWQDGKDDCDECPETDCDEDDE